ncbi:MAG: hypothetical protein J5661_08775 [Bacteroidaceae bacterium]|nr:hypothetical protein [Bacteroidaceae bacterium]
MTAISDFFMMGNPLCMSALTLLLALLFLAAWKAPAWVRNIGLIALACGVLFGVFGVYQMFGVLQEGMQETLNTMQETGDVSPSDLDLSPVIYGGYKCALVPVIYGLIIFIISLIIHLCQKPRI